MDNFHTDIDAIRIVSYLLAGLWHEKNADGYTMLRRVYKRLLNDAGILVKDSDLADRL